MKSSFKGVSFFVENLSFSFESKVNIYEIPGKEKGITENTGQTVTVYNIQAYSIGDSSGLARDQIAYACQDSKPGILFSPSLGMLRVYCRKLEICEHERESRMSRFNLEFVEANDQNTPLSNVDKVAQQIQNAKKLKDEMVSKFFDAMAIVNMPFQALELMKNALAQAFSIPDDALFSMKSAPLNLNKIVELLEENTTKLFRGYSFQKLFESLKKLNNVSADFKNFISSLILEVTVEKLVTNEKISENQLKALLSVIDELTLKSDNKLNIRQLRDLLREHPHQKSVSMCPETGIPGLVLIARAGGDIDKIDYFLHYNDVDNVFFIDKPVEVLLD